jgi:hypothetical protein
MTVRVIYATLGYLMWPSVLAQGESTWN